MYHKALLLAIASTALAAHGSGSHSHLEKRFTFPIPSSKGSVTFDSPKVISGNMTFDGGMKTYGRGVECFEGEGGDSDAVFWVENGGTLKNLIIGSDQIEGVHCMGSCTIQNVWWEAVCEDALSLKTGSGPFTVIGGGAQGAEDKVIQHNSEGTVNIQGFTAYNFGKLYRSCGNCDDMYERHVTISGVTAVEGSVLAGINSNFGDTAVIKSDVCATGVDTICQEYEGNETGEEPPESGSGPSSACKYSEPLSSC